MDGVCAQRPCHMINVMNHPLLIFVLSFVMLELSVVIGDFVRKKLRPLEEGQREDVGVVQAAVMTLLVLLIGFAFSMAVTRYDQRKNYEEEEANAIGTEYLRAGLLPAPDTQRVRELLRQYLDQRVLFYTTHDVRRLRQTDIITIKLQNDLWSVFQARGVSRPTPIVPPPFSSTYDLLTPHDDLRSPCRYLIPFPA